MMLESVLVSFFYKWLTSFPSTTCNAVLIPGLGRSPRGRAQPPTPLFLPGESHREEHSGLQSIGSQTDTTESTEHTRAASFLEHTSLVEENKEHLLEGGCHSLC